MRLLAGETVRCLDRDRIESILRGGVILDIHAARALHDMEFGDRLGCRVGDPLAGFAAEHLLAEDMCGPYVNTYIPLMFVAADSVFKLEPGPSARSLSQITYPNRRPLAPGLVIHQNSMGGRIALLPYVLQAISPAYGGMPHMVCYHRRHMLKAILDWMNPDVLPLWVEAPSLIAVQTWDNGKRLTACLINTSFDKTKALTIRLSDNLAPEQAYTISPSGRKTALRSRITCTAAEGGNAPQPLALPHFPDLLHAVVWRNWELVDVARLAQVLRATPGQIASLAESMGLPPARPISADLKQRNHITLIRRNWHLLPYEQLLELLGWSEEQMAFTLREDDFLWIKLGNLKPACAAVHYAHPTPEARRGAATVVAEVNSLIAEGVWRSQPEARVIVWDWGWNDEWAEDAIRALPQKVWLLSVSEWSLPIERGGVKNTIGEYSISSVGPGPRAKKHWAAARQRGMKTVAKVQINNTWEFSATPYIPRHDDRLSVRRPGGMARHVSDRGF